MTEEQCGQWCWAIQLWLSNRFQCEEWQANLSDAQLCRLNNAT